ncbi:MAG: alpha/beta hydrolase [Marinobacter sp.]|uniref:alpha/beta fold hydrolase n=1 Tax=Marinobacter sp. TaxID=50741 RepID=UPI00299E882C|nr:alpha/beta hydrolase [Marinobacter sp.]MDX1756606.1 alpha/beta hydrolase [Marinobacter sp.]
MINLEQWRQAGSTFEFQGMPVFTRTGGNPKGPAVVLIHGFPTSSWDWSKIWPKLEARFSLYAVDMIGFGDSAKPKDFTYLIQDQATLIETWLRKQRVGEYHILAHDYGDTVAQELIARDLERRTGEREDDSSLRIMSACLLNGGIFPESHQPLLLQKLLLSPVGFLIARLTSKRKLADSLANIFGPDTPPSDEEVEVFWELITRNDGVGVMHKLIHYMPQRQKFRERWVGALLDTEVPVKLINGPLDPISGEHMAERYRQLILDPDVTLLPGIGHYPQVEAPDLVTRHYLEFHNSLGR